MRETDYSFTGTPTDIPVYIPVGSLSSYKSGNGWDRFTNLIECEDLPELPHSGIEEMSAYEENTADASISVRNGRLIIESGADLGFTVQYGNFAPTNFIRRNKNRERKDKGRDSKHSVAGRRISRTRRQDCIQSLNLTPKPGYTTHSLNPGCAQKQTTLPVFHTGTSIGRFD